jgi:hypothetical protein
MRALRVSSLLSLALGVLPFQIGAPDIPPCLCSTREEAEAALHRLGSLDWRQATRSMLAADLPHLVVFPPLREASPGLEAVATEVARCCAVCPIWGGASLEQGPDAPTLWQTGFWVCPRPHVATRDIVQALKEAGLTRTGYTSSRTRAPYGSMELYSWIARREHFTMRVDQIATNEGVVGHIRVARCRSRDIIETWQLAGHRTLSVLRPDIEQSDAEGGTLRFEYVTSCLTGDAACIAPELDALWPRLKSRATDQSATHIVVWATNCTGETVGFSFDLMEDGTWRSRFSSWHPKEPGADR